MINQLHKWIVRSLLGLVAGGLVIWYASPPLLQALKSIYERSPEWLMGAFRLAFFTFFIMVLDKFRRWKVEKLISHSTGEFFSCSVPKKKAPPQLEVKQVIIYRISNCFVNNWLEIIYHIKSTGSKLKTKTLFFSSGEERKFVPEDLTLEELLHIFRPLALDISTSGNTKRIPCVLTKKSGESRIALTLCLDPPINPGERDEAYIYLRLRRPSLWNHLRQFGEDDDCSFNFAILPPSKAVFLFYLPRLVKKASINYNNREFTQKRDCIVFTACGPNLKRVSYTIKCSDFIRLHVKMLRCALNGLYRIWDQVEYFIPHLFLWTSEISIKKRLKLIQELLQEYKI